MVVLKISIHPYVDFFTMYFLKKLQKILELGYTYLVLTYTCIPL